MKFENDKIIIDRELNDLDSFVLRTVDLLSKFTEYVIVSGYVAIILGRSRATEDMDVLVPKMTKKKFDKLFHIFVKKGYWFLNSDNVEKLYGLLATKHAVRISVKGQITPNVEMKFLKDDIDEESLKNRIRIVLGEKEIFVSPLELQIAYKEIILGSDKDIEDSRHIIEVCKNFINKNKLKYYRKVLSSEI